MALRTILLVTLPLWFMAAVASAAPTVSVADLAPDGGPLVVQLRREVARARKRHLIPVVEISADWCKPCIAIKRYLDDPQMVAAFTGVHLVRIQVDDWKTEDMATANIKIRGVPTFFALDPEGHATTATITSSVWGEDIPDNMAPPLKRFFATLK